jgi:hypothetical protein
MHGGGASVGRGGAGGEVINPTRQAPVLAVRAGAGACRLVTTVLLIPALSGIATNDKVPAYRNFLDVKGLAKG